MVDLAAVTQPARSPRGILALALLGALIAGAPAAAVEWLFAPNPKPGEPPPQGPPADVQLILDDGTAEGAVGVSNTEARQFLWFNQFTPDVPPPFLLEEIQVLFPANQDIPTGGAIELVVYLDADGDPSNGADLLLAFPETVQALDGATFSVYPLATPLLIDQPGDVLIGVVNRFTVSGTPPPVAPAALDITSSQGRSWVAIWVGDPPAAPPLPPDDLITLVDVFQPGNWLIRGFGTPVVPALAPAGLAALAALLLALGIAVRRRRRQALRND